MTNNAVGPLRLARTSFAYLVLMALSFTILLPLGWMITVALKPDMAPVFTKPTEWIPTEHWHWENFARALLDPSRPFWRYTINTLVIVAINIVGTVISCSLVGYAFARLRFKGREFLFGVLIVTLLIPWHVLLIPQFLLFHRLGWYGTILPLVVPSFFGNAFFIFLIRQYIRTIPMELELAATIDGCNRFQVFWYIVLPMIRPVLAVCVVFVFLNSWNDLLGPLIYLLHTEDFTLAIGLSNMMSRQNPQLNILMAANLVMMIPPIILYFFAQDKLVGGIASVGLKG
ncbi:MAG TPA: carbohydrate ABC transporter permease [Devosia sp.]|nr:carbohydrate ABC transporter permease [Devosia sp.]